MNGPLPQPKGSKHPSANIMEERIVEKWLDEMAYEKAKSQGMLEWQTEEDAKYEQQKLQRLVTARSSSPSQVRSTGCPYVYIFANLEHPQDERSERSIFFQRGAASPSFQKATSPKSKGLQRDNSSVTNIEFLPNGRVKLPRSRSQHLTPRRSLASLEQDLSASARRKSAVKKSESARALNQPAQESSTSQLALAASTPVDQPSKDKSPSGSPFSFTPASSHQGSVGPSAAPTPPQQTSAAAPSTSAPAFSFSKPPVDSATEPASSSQPTFSFPTSSSSLGTSATKPTTETSFSFDSTAASSTSKPSESSKPAFSFGASPSPSPQLPSASQAGAASSFSFGSSATLTAPQPAEQPKSTFSFAPGASTSASPSPGPSTPTLGVISPSLNQSTLSKPANEGPSAFNFGGTSKPQTSASGFSFGSSASASTASKPADEPKPTFSFGSAGTTSNSLGASTSQSGAASSGFSFGSAPSTSSAPSQSSAPSTSFAFGQSQQQASSGFTFGAGSNAPSQPGTPSTFKFELGPGGGSPSLASGGSSQPRGFRAGRSNPSRRRI